VARTVTLDIGDVGKQIELRSGHNLDVSLKANPTTGYRWEVEELDDNVLREVGEPAFKPQSKLVGAPGVEILHFQAVGEGQTTLKLIYHRSWEKDVEPLETYSVQVVVR